MLSSYDFDFWARTQFGGQADDQPGDVYRTPTGRLTTIGEAREYLRRHNLYEPGYLTYTAQRARFGLQVGPYRPEDGYEPVFLMPTRLSEQFFAHTRDKPLEVTLFQDLYRARRGEEAPEAVVAMDRALSRPGLGEQLNRLLGVPVYREGKGLVGSLLVTFGRVIDQTVLGYDAFERHVRERKGQYRGSISKYLRGEPEFEKGPFETGAEFLYKTGLSAATAVTFYLGISLPLSYVFTSSVEALVSTSLDTDQLIARGNTFERNFWLYRLTRKLVMGSSNAELFEQSVQQYVAEGFPGDKFYPIVDKFDPNDVGGAWLRTSINVGRRLNQEVFQRVMVPILRGMVSFDPSEVEAQNAFEMALANFSEMLGRPMGIEFMPIGPFGRFTATHISYEERVEKLASLMDEIAGYIPLNPLYWVPAVRETLGLPKQKKAETPTLADFMSFEKIAIWSKELSSSLFGLAEDFFFPRPLTKAMRQAGLTPTRRRLDLRHHWRLLGEMQQLQKLEKQVYANLKQFLPPIDGEWRIQSINQEAFALLKRYQEQAAKVREMTYQIPDSLLRLSLGFVASPPDPGAQVRMRPVQNLRGALVLIGSVLLLDRFIDVGFLSYQGISLAKQIAGMQAAKDQGETTFDIRFRAGPERYISNSLALIAGGIAGLAIPRMIGNDAKAAAAAADLSKQLLEYLTERAYQKSGERIDFLDKVDKDIRQVARQVRRHLAGRLGAARTGGFNFGAALVAALAVGTILDAWSGLRARLENASKPIWGGVQVESTNALVAARLERLATQTLTNPNATAGEIAQAAATLNLIHSLYRREPSMGEVINVASQVTTPILQVAFTSQTRLQPGLGPMGWPVGTVTKTGVSIQLMPTTGLGLSLSLPFMFVQKSTNAAFFAYNLKTWQKSSPVLGSLYQVKRLLDLSRLPLANVVSTPPTQGSYGGGYTPALVYEPDTLLERAFLGAGAASLSLTVGAALDPLLSRLPGPLGREYAQLRPVTTALMKTLGIVEFTTSAAVALPLQMSGAGFDALMNIVSVKIDPGTGQPSAYKFMEHPAFLQVIGKIKRLRKHHLPYLLSYILASAALDADSGAVRTQTHLDSRFFDPGQQLGAFTLTAAASAILYQTGAARSPQAILGTYFARVGPQEEQIIAAAKELYERVAADKGFDFADFLAAYKRTRTQIVSKYQDVGLVVPRRLLTEMAADSLIETMQLTRTIQVGENAFKQLKLQPTGIGIRGRVKAAALGFITVYVGLNALAQILPAETLHAIHRLPFIGSAFEFITGVKPKKTPEHGLFYRTGFRHSQEQAGLWGTLTSFFRRLTLGALTPQEALYSDEADPFLSIGGRIGASFKPDQEVIFLQIAGAAMDFSMSQYSGGGRIGDKSALIAYYRTLTNIHAVRHLPPRRDRARIINQIGPEDFDLAFGNRALLLALKVRQYKLEHLRTQTPIELQLDVMRELILANPSLRAAHPATTAYPAAPPLVQLYGTGLRGILSWRRWSPVPEKIGLRLPHLYQMRGYRVVQGEAEELPAGQVQSRPRGLSFFGIESSRLIQPLGMVARLVLGPGIAVGLMSTIGGISAYLRQMQRRTSAGFLEQVALLSDYAQDREFLRDDPRQWRIVTQEGVKLLVKEEVGRQVTIGSASHIYLGDLESDPAGIIKTRGHYQLRINTIFAIDPHNIQTSDGDLNIFLSKLAMGQVSNLDEEIEKTAQSIVAQVRVTLLEGRPSPHASSFGAIFFPDLVQKTEAGNLSTLSDEKLKRFEQELFDSLKQVLGEVKKVQVLQEYQTITDPKARKLLLTAGLEEALYTLRPRLSHGGSQAATPPKFSKQEIELFRTAKKMQSETESFLKSAVKGILPTTQFLFNWAFIGKDIYTLGHGVGELLSAGRGGNYYAAKSIALSTSSLLVAELVQQILRRIIPGQSSLWGSIATLGAAVATLFSVNWISEQRWGRWIKDLNQLLIKQSTNLVYDTGRLITGSLIGKSAFVGLSALAGYAFSGRTAAVLSALAALAAVEGSGFRLFDKYVGEPLFLWSLRYRTSENPVEQILANFFLPQDSRWVEMLESRRPGPRSALVDNRFLYVSLLKVQKQRRVDLALRTNQISEDVLHPELFGRQTGFWHEMSYTTLVESGRLARVFDPYTNYLSASQRVVLRGMQQRLNALVFRSILPPTERNKGWEKTLATTLLVGMQFAVVPKYALTFGPVLALYVQHQRTLSDLDRQSIVNLYDPRDYLYRYRELRTYRLAAELGGAFGVVLPRGLAELAGALLADKLADSGLFDADAQEAYEMAPVRLLGRTPESTLFYRMAAPSPLMRWLAPKLKGRLQRLRLPQWLPKLQWRGWARATWAWLDNFLQGPVEDWLALGWKAWQQVPLEGKGGWSAFKRLVKGAGTMTARALQLPGHLGGWIGRAASSRWMAPAMILTGTGILIGGSLLPENRRSFWSNVAVIGSTVALWRGHNLLLTRFGWYNRLLGQGWGRLGVHAGLVTLALLGSGLLPGVGIDGKTARSLLFGSVAFAATAGAMRLKGLPRAGLAGLAVGTLAAMTTHEKGQSILQGSVFSILTLFGFAYGMEIVRQAQKIAEPAIQTVAERIPLPKTPPLPTFSRLSGSINRSWTKVWGYASKHWGSLLGYGMDAFAFASGTATLLTANLSGGMTDMRAYQALLQMRAASRSFNRALLLGVMFGGWGEFLGSLSSNLDAERDADYVGRLVYTAQLADISASTLALQQLKESTRSLAFTTSLAVLYQQTVGMRVWDVLRARQTLAKLNRVGQTVSPQAYFYLLQRYRQTRTVGGPLMRLVRTADGSVQALPRTWLLPEPQHVEAQILTRAREFLRSLRRTAPDLSDAQAQQLRQALQRAFARGELPSNLDELLKGTADAEQLTRTVRGAQFRQIFKRWVPQLASEVTQELTPAQQALVRTLRLADKVPARVPAKHLKGLRRVGGAAGTLLRYLDVGIGIGITGSGIYKLVTARDKYERASGIRRTVSGLVQTGVAFLNMAIATAIISAFTAGGAVGGVGVGGVGGFAAGVATAMAVTTAISMATEHFTNVVVDHILENWVPPEHRVPSRYNRRLLRQTDRQTKPRPYRDKKVVPKGGDVLRQDRQQLPKANQKPKQRQEYTAYVSEALTPTRVQVAPTVVFELNDVAVPKVFAQTPTAAEATHLLNELTRGRISYEVLDQNERGEYLVRIKNAAQLDVATELLRRGYGIVNPRLEQTDPDRYRHYKAIEKEAKRRQVGFWHPNAARNYGPKRATRVKKTDDGDTFQLTDGTKVRLYGIDAPEMGQDKKTGGTLARQAKDTLRWLLAGEVTYQNLGLDNKGERVLGRVFTQKGENVEALMVRQGMAFVSPLLEEKDPQYFRQLKALEEQARQEKLGVWSDEFAQYRRERPWEYRKRKREGGVNPWQWVEELAVAVAAGFERVKESVGAFGAWVGWQLSDQNVKPNKTSQGFGALEQRIAEGFAPIDVGKLFGGAGDRSKNASPSLFAAFGAGLPVLVGWIASIPGWFSPKKTSVQTKPPSALETTSPTYKEKQQTQRQQKKEDTPESENLFARFWRWLKGIFTRKPSRPKVSERRIPQEVGTLAPGDEVSIHALVDAHLAHLLELGGRTRYTGKKFTGSAGQGLNILVADLQRTAPEYFNTQTAKGRAALFIATVIAGGEFTREIIHEVPKNPRTLYTGMGGSGNRMQGWAQFDSRYHRRFFGEDPAKYNRYIGEILYGKRQVPTAGNRYFNMDEFARLFASGKFKNAEEAVNYLRRQFSRMDWQGLYDSGAQRLRQYGIQDQAFAIFAAPAPVAQPTTLKKPNIQALMTLVNMAGRSSSQVTQETELGARLAEVARKRAAGRRSQSKCYSYAADAIELTITGRTYSGYLSGTSAYMAADELAQKKEFREVKGFTVEDMLKMPKGTVLVWGPRMSLSGGPHGHIAIVIGDGLAASDHIEDLRRYRTTRGVRAFVPVGSQVKKTKQEESFRGLRPGDYFPKAARDYLVERARVVGGDEAALAVAREIDAYNTSLPPQVKARAVALEALGLNPSGFRRPEGTVRVYGSRRTEETPQTVFLRTGESLHSPLARATLRDILAYKPLPGQGFYAMRAGGRMHRKLDLDARVGGGTGEWVTAMTAGVAEMVDWGDREAMVRVTSVDDLGRTITIEYGHLNKRQVYELFGQKRHIRVQAGQRLATIASHHLDLGIRVDGAYVDVQKFIQQELNRRARQTSSAAPPATPAATSKLNRQIQSPNKKNDKTPQDVLQKTKAGGTVSMYDVLKTEVTVAATAIDEIRAKRLELTNPSSTKPTQQNKKQKEEKKQEKENEKERKQKHQTNLTKVNLQHTILHAQSTAGETAKTVAAQEYALASQMVPLAAAKTPQEPAQTPEPKPTLLVREPDPTQPPANDLAATKETPLKRLPNGTLTPDPTTPPPNDLPLELGLANFA